MNSKPIIAALTESLAADDRDKANELLSELYSANLSEDELSELFLLLDDSSDDVGNMYGIIHVSERAVPDKFYRAFAKTFSQLALKSPNWASLLVARHLAASSNNTSGFDARLFLKSMHRLLDKNSRSHFHHICTELKDAGKIAPDIEHDLLG
ncbi:immunity 30 family protein [Blastopirellula sp. JC732]|uniref:Immunity 30 family protein n=1 Tax=Blastopirellula sediminis TaxID=2894196 RepID=A0A9X1SIX2_9BACT|nr:Imm30 family immunity protein [Blastopirellula sediminis]MCC9604978.1 immunity 30 family protein [Blastopirellula sediminis]MCC9631722.1 immunity 30 family protein [Blastopirellula sediminis]